MKYEDSVRKIKGVGEKAQQNLKKLKIETLGDLIHHFPRDFDSFDEPVAVENLRPGEVMAISVFLKDRGNLLRTKSGMNFQVTLKDGTGEVKAIWYHMPFLQRQLKMGTRYLIRGKVSRYRGGLIFEHPKIYTPAEFMKNVGRLLPIYPLTEGITQNAMRKYTAQALESLDDLTEFLPSDIRKKYNFPTYKAAVRGVHYPKNREEFRQGRRRLVFDEMFLYLTAMKNLKVRNQKPNSYVLNRGTLTQGFLDRLPFSLTKGQEEACKDIERDMQGPFVMNRLLQGDVGSGKTMVAVFALLLAVDQGYQGAFMVPTEVLANQHYQSLTNLLEPLGVQICLLTGSLKEKEKKEARVRIQEGSVDLIVGTHAMIQDSVEFKDLAVVVTDEQHRFGVRQRQSLQEKGLTPHVLAMSATPIPRTLGLILYGDMDFSQILDKPANRLPIKNCVVGEEYRETAYRFLLDQLQSGHQVYIICPMIEENESDELKSVEGYCERLEEIYPEHVVIQALHGKMKPKDKEKIMKEFAAGKIQILVSTTVIEVGIDVPNATVMMIENSERFGLATLHQLRGRVGRGKDQSYCIFFYGHKTKETLERLDILNQSNDGAAIASWDMKLRGQGDFFGERQSGEKLFELGDVLADGEILQIAKKESEAYTLEDLMTYYRKNKRFLERIRQYMGEVPL